MVNKYQNKYRIPSARLQTWDYSSNGAYFITICTQNREHFFGKIENGDMQLNEIGLMAEQFWAAIPQHFEFVELGNFVIMPNHVHGILIINQVSARVETLQCNVCTDEDSVETLQCNVCTCNVCTCNVCTDVENDSVETLQCNVCTTNDDSATTDNGAEKNEQMAKISPKPGSVSTIIRSYKSVVTKNARFVNADFGWQTRFHDHIIRNAVSFDNIQNYITNNPSSWAADTFY